MKSTDHSPADGAIIKALIEAIAHHVVVKESPDGASVSADQMDDFLLYLQNEKPEIASYALELLDDHIKPAMAKHGQKLRDSIAAHQTLYLQDKLEAASASETREDQEVVAATDTQEVTGASIANATPDKQTAEAPQRIESAEAAKDADVVEVMEDTEVADAVEVVDDANATDRSDSAAANASDANNELKSVEAQPRTPNGASEATTDAEPTKPETEGERPQSTEQEAEAETVAEPVVQPVSAEQNQDQSDESSDEPAAQVPQDTAAAQPSTASSTTRSTARSTAPLPQPGQVPEQSKPVQKPAPKISIKVANATVGVPYSAEIRLTELQDRMVVVKSIEFEQDIGLKFDAKQQTLVGTPTQSGEFTLTLAWHCADYGDGQQTHALMVNSDPRSLWQVKEPPEGLDYRKSHTDACYVPWNDGRQLVAVSRRGRSHEHQGSFRDDDMSIGAHRDSGWATLMVADGAGSAKLSRQGSRLAVRAVERTLKHFFESSANTEFVSELDKASDASEIGRLAIKYLYQGVIYKAAYEAVKAIEEAASDKGNGYSPRDFATTLLLTLVRPFKDRFFVISFWMGDGAIAVVSEDGKARLMGKPDGGEFAGQTRFLDKAALSSASFWERINTGVFDDLTAVILMTDGVSDPKFVTDNDLEDSSKWMDFWEEIKQELDKENPQEALLEWLHFFVKSYHDDRTLAVLY